MKAKSVHLGKWWALISLLFLALLVSGQPDPSVVNGQITSLLIGLANHSVKPSDVLDPSLSQEQRQKNLDYFSGSYELTLVVAGPIQINADATASAPVKVDFKNANTQVSTQSTAQFVKRNGVWYFANFSFVSFPAIIVVVIIICVIVGISYATGVLVLRARLRRQGKLDRANEVKIFIPVFWPALFGNARMHGPTG